MAMTLLCGALTGVRTNLAWREDAENGSPIFVVSIGTYRSD